MNAPFPYFGGKRSIAADVWARFGRPTQYIEPFCGSAAMLLSAPEPASLEVVNDANGFIANFWRAVKHQPGAVAEWADYPVSHIDLGARHRWLMEHRSDLDALHDPDWPGDAKIAGWWLWGQCAWIGSGWCEWTGQVPHVSNAGRGVQALGKVPHVSDAGMGVQALGRVPHVSNAGMGVQAPGQVPQVSNAGMGQLAVEVEQADPTSQADGARARHLLTSGGRTAWRWLHALAARLERVRVVHGDWQRCLNHHYGGSDTAVFLDPPYEGYEGLYRAESVAAAVAAWAQAHPHLRVALCGHVGDYELPGWAVQTWTRAGSTYGSTKTTAAECVWYAPACLDPHPSLF